MRLTSPVFEDDGDIPERYTCEGQDVSPPLAWSELPHGTKSLALIVDDPDAPDPEAPRRTWVHWVLLDIQPATDGLEEDVGEPPGGKVGVNDWGRTEWGGPCPPIGRHRYVFKLYALDTTLELDRPTKADVERAMQGHVLDQATLVGHYRKQRG